MITPKIPSSLRVSTNSGSLPGRIIQLRNSGGLITSIRMYADRSELSLIFPRTSMIYKGQLIDGVFLTDGIYLDLTSAP